MKLKTTRLARAVAASILITLATGWNAEAGEPSARYRSRYVTATGLNAEAIERECDAIVERLCARYGTPARWRTFRVRVEPRAGGAIAGYTLYSEPNVVEVVSFRSLEESRGSVLDHEMTHAFFFYLLGSNFDLLVNEGLAQNSEYRERARLRDQVWRRYSAGEFLPLAALYGRNEYDGAALLYTEGFSVVDFLVGRGGSRWFAEFVAYLTHDARDVEDALSAFYGYATLDELERDWLEYVRAGQARSSTRRVALFYNETQSQKGTQE